VDFQQMTSPCGLDCFNCPMFLAKGDKGLRRDIAKKRGIPYDRVICHGCRNEKGTIAALNMTEPCSVYRCIEGKNIAFCFECSDFPCDHLHPYADQAYEVAHNTKVFNLCLIKKMGLESWAKAKAEKVADTYFRGKLRL